jgi:hypothetical protein
MRKKGINRDTGWQRTIKANVFVSSIQYGKFAYYFRCGDCNSNTPIKINCGIDDHKERIRKDERAFYRECAECKSSLVFFTNPA